MKCFLAVSPYQDLQVCLSCPDSARFIQICFRVGTIFSILQYALYRRLTPYLHYSIQSHNEDNGYINNSENQ